MLMDFMIYFSMNAYITELSLIIKASALVFQGG